MGTQALVVLAALLIGGAFFAIFLRLEVSGRRHVQAQMIIVLLLVEQLIHPNEAQTPAGLFRVPVGPVDMRPIDFVVVAALAARLATSSLPTKVGRSALLWTGFAVWYSAMGVVGYLNGNLTSEVVFQGRLLISGVGVMIVVAGCDVRKLIAADAVGRFGRAVGIVAMGLFATHLAGLSFGLAAPVVGFDSIGALGGDARTILPSLGIATVLNEVAQSRRRMTVILPSAVMVISPIVASQAGPYLALLAALAVLAAVATTATWRARTQLSASDVVFSSLVIAGVAALGFFASGGQSPAFVGQFEDAVLSDSQSTTTSERVQLWDEATERVWASPVWGEGLGVRGTIERPWPQRAATATFHNVGFDIAVRSGLVGLGLLVFALISSLFDARRVWLHHSLNTIATLTLAATVAIAALGSRSFVSSTFERSRVVAALFIAIGIILAARRDLEARPSLETDGLVEITPAAVRTRESFDTRRS